MATDGTRFKHVNYPSLTARQKEIFNFQKIAATLADCGYNCIKLGRRLAKCRFLGLPHGRR